MTACAQFKNGVGPGWTHPGGARARACVCTGEKTCACTVSWEYLVCTCGWCWCAYCVCVCVCACAACVRVSEQCSTRRLLTSLRHHRVVLADDEDACGRTLESDRLRAVSAFARRDQRYSLNKHTSHTHTHTHTSTHCYHRTCAPHADAKTHAAASSSLSGDAHSSLNGEPQQHPPSAVPRERLRATAAREAMQAPSPSSGGARAEVPSDAAEGWGVRDLVKMRKGC
jgi:hypothetical protein